MVPQGKGLDRYAAVIVPDAEGLWTYRVDAWSDPWSTWRHAVEVKVAAGQDADELANDLETGARLLERVSRRPDRNADRALLGAAVTALRDVEAPLADRVDTALSDHVLRIMHEHPVRELVTKGKPMKLWVDRKRAAFGSWYEFFPRSTGGLDESGRPVHGTFATATAELDRIAAMKFDVVYLPPIHPIGRVNRKGANNTLGGTESDVGSPWAIGADEGGHDAIHPELGTIEDFDAFVARARELDLEVALDLALQAAPDHPWVLKHPEFFTTRPDGSHRLRREPAQEVPGHLPDQLRQRPARHLRRGAARRTALDRARGVDLPGGQPAHQAAGLLGLADRARSRTPTPTCCSCPRRSPGPPILWGLARLGFTQSYTYFTWRTTKEELIEFGVDLVEHADDGRPNLFVNTPDILHESLQHGGPGMFALRAALAGDDVPDLGRVLRATSCSSTRPCGRAARST